MGHWNGIGNGLDGGGNVRCINGCGWSGAEESSNTELMMVVG